MQKSIFGSLALLALGLPIGAAAENDQEPRSIPTDTAKVYDIDEIVVIEQPKEAYRLQKQILHDGRPVNLDLALIYSSKETLPYKTVANAVRRILESVVEHL